MKCRHCRSELDTTFVDLGTAPPSNAYLTVAALAAPERWYPLRVLVYSGCWLVQTEDCVGAEELFSADYAYFSSYASTWLRHVEEYVDAIVPRFNLGRDSLVVEVATNDGYLLQYVQALDIPCLGVELTADTAAVARAKGIEIVEDFFGACLARELVAHDKQADLMVANNVLAHVPDINDFVSGFARLLKPAGVATFEFPHLLRLVQECLFDTIYHEHYSYLSLTTVEGIFRTNGLSVFDVEEISTHGGSLRVFAQRLDTGRWPVTPRVAELLAREEFAGVRTLAFYEGFQDRVNRIKLDLLAFLVEAQRSSLRVAAYGAAAKGNTLLNYAGVWPDLLPYVVDRNPAKQGKYLPGSRIPIVAEAHLRRDPSPPGVHPALEPERRGNGTTCMHKRVGRSVHNGCSIAKDNIAEST